MPVTEPQRLSGEVQFQTDTGSSRNMNGHVPAAQPVLITSAVLTVAQWSLAVNYTGGIVFLPQMFEGFALSGKSTADFFRIEVTVKFGLDRFACLVIQPLCDEFVGNFLRQGIREFLTFPEPFQEFVHRGLSVAGCLCDLTTAHAARVVQRQDSFVVHVWTSSDMDSSCAEEVVPL